MKKEPEIMFVIFAKWRTSENWYEQETTTDESFAREIIERNRRYVKIMYEDDAGRDYVLTRRVSTFEVLL